MAPVNNASLWYLVQVINSRLYYQLICNPAPAYSRTRPGSNQGVGSFDLGNATTLRKGLGHTTDYIIMPDIYFAQPPRCNVLFPSMVTQFSYSDSFTVAPTRTLAIIPGFQGTGGILKYAPSEVEPNTDQRRSVLTAEEKIRGFIPNIIHVSPAEADASTEGNVGGVNDLDHIVNYRHWLDNYATRASSGTGPFNPFLAVGFPAAVLDRGYGIIAGSLRSLQHFLDFSGGTAYTTFEMGLCRHASTPDDDEQPAWKVQREGFAPEALYPDPDKPEQTSWYDDAFSDARIGQTLYRPILGYQDSRSGGIITSQEDADGTPHDETAKEALERIRREHLSASPDAQSGRLGSMPSGRFLPSTRRFWRLGPSPTTASCGRTSPSGMCRTTRPIGPFCRR